MHLKTPFFREDIFSGRLSYFLGPSKLSSFFQPYFSVSRTIKSVMEAFGKDKEDYRAIGTFPIAGGFFFFCVSGKY